ncbi:MAG: PHP domain-containing protein [Bacillota bacterium]|nr:PHP domain-containing protein [Bacillota bacterium]
MKSIKADLHIHTIYSPDSKQGPEQIVRRAKKKGIGAVALCDHNTCESFNWISENTDKDGVYQGIIVVPACEISTDRGHILGLFLKEPLNLDSLVSTDVYSYKDVHSAIKKAGGIVCAAHPFESVNVCTDYLSMVDCIEVYNARAASINDKANSAAAVYAEKISKPYTAGSDAHILNEIGNAFLEVKLVEVSLLELKTAVLKGDGIVWGKESSMRNRALSQLIKQYKLKNEPALFKRILVLTFFCLIDLLKFAGLINKDKGTISMKEGNAHVSNSKDREKS